MKKLSKHFSKKQIAPWEVMFDVLNRVDRKKKLNIFENSTNLNGIVTGPYSVSSITNYSNINTVKDDVIIIRSDGTRLNVGDILEELINIGFIVPNNELFKTSPALEDAYNEYRTQLKNSFPKLYSSIESYKFIETLVKDNT